MWVWDYSAVQALTPPPARNWSKYHLYIAILEWWATRQITYRPLIASTNWFVTWTFHGSVLALSLCHHDCDNSLTSPPHLHTIGQPLHSSWYSSSALQQTWTTSPAWRSATGASRDPSSTNRRRKRRKRRKRRMLADCCHNMFSLFFFNWILFTS